LKKSPFCPSQDSGKKRESGCLIKLSYDKYLTAGHYSYFSSFPVSTGGGTRALTKPHTTKTRVLRGFSAFPDLNGGGEHDPVNPPIIASKK